MTDEKTVVDREVGEHIVRLNAARQAITDASMRDTVDATIWNTRHVGDLCPKLDKLAVDVEAIPDAVILKLNGNGNKSASDMMIPIKAWGFSTKLPLKAVIGMFILIVGVWLTLELRGKGGDILKGLEEVRAMRQPTEHVAAIPTTGE